MSDLVPAVFRCSRHDRVLTEDVVAKVTATPVKAARAGFRLGFGSQRRPFRVIVHCPEGGGHELTFAGSHVPARTR